MNTKEQSYLFHEFKKAICAVTDCRKIKSCHDCALGKLTLATAGDVKIIDMFQMRGSGTKQKPKQKTIDVVRCKDCKYYRSGRTIIYPMCSNDGGLIETTPESFCSYGERR